MEYFLSLLPSIQQWGIWGYWIFLLVAALESSTFVGIILPGSAIVVIAGLLSAQGFFDIGDMIWFVAMGAIMGDNISYYLGRHAHQFFKKENKIFKLSHVKKGELFFQKHGNKSVFLGRFIGPIRSIVPFIAGLSQMNYWTFLFWNVTSAFIWSATTLGIGYFFGGTLNLFK